MTLQFISGGLIVALILIVTWVARVVYSIYFSPLRAIPSPLLYQWFPFFYDLTVARGDTPFVLEKLHEEYGPIFRVGWKVVIVATPDACAQLYSNYDFAKGKLYDSLKYFGENLLSERTRQGHSLRKRLIAPAFTKANVKKMEPTVKKVGLMPLLENIDQACRQNTVINMYSQFHHMSWDIIGELAFGQSFQMLVKGAHPAVKWLNSTLNFTMLFYVFPFLSKFKVDAGEKLREFSYELLDKYFEIASRNQADDSLMRFLIDATDKSGNKLSRDEIFAEAHVMLLAGTDTTSNSLTLMLHQLMRYPQVDAKLFQELKNLDMDLITSEACRDHCPYLEAFIKEAMRTLPAVAITPIRIVPNEGATISGYFLPGGTQVGVPLYAIQHSKLIWPKPHEFIPERWLETCSDPSIKVTETMLKSFIPFLSGPNGCAGRNLAELEINIVLANLLVRYRFESAEPLKELDLVALPVSRPRDMKLLAKVYKR